MSDVVTVKNAAVSQAVFDAFMQSGETAGLTQAECAAKLGMKESSFVQRLTMYRKSIKNAVEIATKLGKLDKIPESVRTLPVFKPAPRGRTGQRQEHNGTERALLAFLND